VQQHQTSLAFLHGSALGDTGSGQQPPEPINGMREALRPTAAVFGIIHL
jgi:hypothetical protein